MYCVTCGKYSLSPLCRTCAVYGTGVPGGSDPNIFDRKTGLRLKNSKEKSSVTDASKKR